MIFTIVKSVLVVTIVIPALLTLVMDLVMESPIQPQINSYLGKRRPFTGPLAVNNILTNSKRLYENEVVGPESVTVREGVIYTGTADGKIIKLKDGKMEIIARLGKEPCGSYENEPTCGRPLGMRFDPQGALIVADAYLGLFRVNVTDGKIEELFSSSKKIGGHESRFLNDLDITKDGMIYVTDSSTKWGRRNFRECMHEAISNGRLIEYNPKTKEAKVLLNELYFGNGVQLSQDESYLLISETTVARILKYHLKGPKAGEVEVLIDNLPGFPDNIRKSSTGGFWISFAILRHPDTFPIAEIIAVRPWMRRIYMKWVTLERKFGYDFFGNTVMHKTSHGAIIIEINEKGEIVRSLHDPNKSVVPSVSEVEDVNGELYMGSYYSRFILYLDTNNLDHSTS